MKQIYLSLLFLIPLFGFSQITCNTYTTGPISMAIPDGAEPEVQGSLLFIPITVTETTPITDIRINVDLTHTYVGDLVLQLQGPNGIGFNNIWDRSCNTEQFQNIDMTFKDGSPEITCASPTTGIYNPASPMTGFTNGDPSGVWYLVFVDFFSGDTGVVNEWSIELCTDPSLNVENFELHKGVSIFPNPTSNFLTISNLKNAVNYIIINQLGQEILKGNIDSNEEIDIKSLKNGLYFLKLENKKLIKFIKK